MKLLVLHHQSNTVRLKFFPLGGREDLLTGIREVLDIPVGSPLLFRDSEGDAVALAPSGIPDGTRLHVAVEEGVALRLSSAAKLGMGMTSDSVSLSTPTTKQPTTIVAPWQWHSSSAKGSHNFISEDKMTFDTSDNGMESCQSFWGITESLPSAGIFYATFLFSKRFCCLAFGAIPASRITLPGSHLITSPEFPHLLSLMGLGAGPDYADTNWTSGAPGMMIGVYVDADAGRMVFVDHSNATDPRKAVRVDGVKMPIRIAIQGPKHHVHVTIKAEAVPDGIFLEDSCVISTIYKRPE